MRALFAIADAEGKLQTRDHPTANDAWRELIPDLPEDSGSARAATLKWVGRGFRVVDRSQGT
ncbi:MAG: hypothetical protein AAFQ82_26995 [Myxococcota bacterium]